MVQPVYASTFQSLQPTQQIGSRTYPVAVTSGATMMYGSRTYPIASTSGAAMQYGAMVHTYLASRLEGGKSRPTTGLIYPQR